MKTAARHMSKLPGLALLFLFLLAPYVYFFPRWADPNQNSRLDMVVAVVEDGTFRIDPYVENTVDYARVGDHYYSDKAPGAAFLGIPVYAALKGLLDLPVLEGLVERLGDNATFRATLNESGTGIQEQKVRFAIAQVALAFVAGALPTAWSGVLLFILAGAFTRRAWPRLAAALGYGLLTPAFAYAGAFYGHQLSAALLLSAFAIVFTAHRSLMRFAPGRPTSRAAPLGSLALIGVGALLGYSVVTEYPAALIAGLLFLYTLVVLNRQGHALGGPSRRGWGILWAVLPASLIALGWMAYNTAVFGGPLNLGYGYSELWQEQHETGFMSLAWPSWQALWGITFSPFRGLFLLSPLLLLALPGFVVWGRRWPAYRLELWVAALSVLAMFLFNMASVMWWGGFAVGPRYLLPGLPFLALALAPVFQAALYPNDKAQQHSQPWRRWAFVLLALFLAAPSLVFTWGLALAGQSFPSDTLRNPLLEWALPHWLDGNLARNLGTLLGLPGLWSLFPLLLFLATLALAGWLLFPGRLSAVRPAHAGLAHTDRPQRAPTATEKELR